MSPYREPASPLALPSPSLWGRLRASFRRFWAQRKLRKCVNRDGHFWVASRHWDFQNYRPDLYARIPRNLGVDAVCEYCGKSLQTFQKTGEVLRALRYMKGGTAEGLVHHTSQRLIQEIGPILRDACLPGDTMTFPGRKEFLWWKIAEDHDPNDVFHEKYVYEGRTAPEYEDDAE